MAGGELDLGAEIGEGDHLEVAVEIVGDLEVAVEIGGEGINPEIGTEVAEDLHPLPIPLGADLEIGGDERGHLEKRELLCARMNAKMMIIAPLREAQSDPVED